MSFVTSLGIDFKLLLSQMLNFGLLLWLLTKFLYKPILKRIEKDEAQLMEVKKQKQQLEKEKRAFRRQKEEEMAKIRQRSRQIIKEAEEIAKQIKKSSQEQGEKDRQATIKQIRALL